MRITVSAILFFCIASLSGCTNPKPKDTGNELRIIVPGHLEAYNPFLTDTIKSQLVLDDHTKRFKIYSLINVSCSSCLLKLEKWNDLYTKLINPKNVSIVLMCYSKDNFELLKFLFENHKIPKIELPLMLDYEDNFRKQNQSLTNKLGDFTVLTDDNNRVLLTGNPIENKNEMNEFVRAMQNNN